MFRHSLFAWSLLLCGSALAQNSLTDQINAVAAAQERERAQQQMLQRAEADRVAKLAAQQRAAAIAIEQQRIAAQAAIEQQRMAAQKAAREEAMVDKRRDQDYEDQLRSLQIQQAKLKLLEEQQRVTSDKEREQVYQDKLRALDLQQRAQELKRVETRVARENDIIDRELRHQDAQTDVVQSGADATRNMSGGAKVLMEDVGTAAIRAQDRPVQARVTDR
jgi:hypothetical protein